GARGGVKRHCEHPGLAFGKPEYRLREAIQGRQRSTLPWIASELTLLAMTANRLEATGQMEMTTTSGAEAVEQAIRSRRAIRAFRPDRVEPALVRRLLELAAQAPSGTNMQPWKVRVLGPESRARLEAALLAALDDPEFKPEEEYRYYP